ncbi:hypothetical protein SeLEV6574_g03550 [Synchytrium endobioticum]|nr:hypothetical protein SeLEV6574_g03550 [Synchytrium endobioticum]
MSDTEGYDSSPSPSHNQIDMMEPDLNAPSGTTSFHFVVKSRLGFCCWKDWESSLYAYFEKTFRATQVALKMTEHMDQYAIEVEMPNSYASSFDKVFKKTLAQELDRVHGIPTIARWKDVRIVSSLGKAPGTTDPKTVGKASTTLLAQRLTALHAAGLQRQREIDGIHTQWDALSTEIYRRLAAIDAHYGKKCVDEVLARLELVQNEVLDAVKRDLGMLGTPPSKEKEDEAESVASKSRMPSGGYGFGGGVLLSSRSPSPQLPHSPNVDVSTPQVVSASSGVSQQQYATVCAQAASVSTVPVDVKSGNASVGMSKLNPARDGMTSDHSTSVGVEIVAPQPTVVMCAILKEEKDVVPEQVTPNEEGVAVVVAQHEEHMEKHVTGIVVQDVGSLEPPCEEEHIIENDASFYEPAENEPAPVSSPGTTSQPIQEVV